LSIANKSLPGIFFLKSVSSTFIYFKLIVTVPLYGVPSSRATAFAGNVADEPSGNENNPPAED